MKGNIKGRSTVGGGGKHEAGTVSETRVRLVQIVASVIEKEPSRRSSKKKGSEEGTLETSLETYQVHWGKRRWRKGLKKKKS